MQTHAVLKKSMKLDNEVKYFYENISGWWNLSELTHAVGLYLNKPRSYEKYKFVHF